MKYIKFLIALVLVFSFSATVFGQDKVKVGLIVQGFPDDTITRRNLGQYYRQNFGETLMIVDRRDPTRRKDIIVRAEPIVMGDIIPMIDEKQLEINIKAEENIAKYEAAKNQTWRADQFKRNGLLDLGISAGQSFGRAKLDQLIAKERLKIKPYEYETTTITAKVIIEEINLQGLITKEMIGVAKVRMNRFRDQYGNQYVEIGDDSLATKGIQQGTRVVDRRYQFLYQLAIIDAQDVNNKVIGR